MSPAAPPAHASSRLSITSWRTMRARLPPMAAAHGDLLLPPDAPREQQVGDVARTRSAAPATRRRAAPAVQAARSAPARRWSGCTTARTSRLNCGYSASSWRLIVSISARACSIETPSRSRATGKMPGCQPRSSGKRGGPGTDRHVDIGRLKQLEAAPAKHRRPRRAAYRVARCGRARRRGRRTCACHSASLMTTTPAAPGASSSGEGAGRAATQPPASGAASTVTMRAGGARPRPYPSASFACVRNAATASNVVLRSRQSM